jgi:hypothetical protein
MGGGLHLPRAGVGMSALRAQAAAWYRNEAVRQARGGSGAVATMFNRFAGRIENGDADHRLPVIISGQADYDREATQ